MASEAGQSPPRDPDRRTPDQRDPEQRASDRRGAPAATTRESSREHPSGRSDDELIRAWEKGDDAALAELLRGYQPRVYAVCYRMLQSSDEAVDLTQEALTKILEGLHTFGGRSQFSTWAIRVTMNCCLSHLRRLRLRRHRSLDDPETARERAGGGEPPPVDRVEQADRIARVELALSQLDPEARAIIVLRDVQGLDYQQIGEVLSVPVGTVKSRLFRARAALRELVEGLSGDDRPEGGHPTRPADTASDDDANQRDGRAPTT